MKILLVNVQPVHSNVLHVLNLINVLNVLKIELTHQNVSVQIILMKTVLPYVQIVHTIVISVKKTVSVEIVNGQELKLQFVVVLMDIMN
jgi:hypothetical protein